VDQVRRLKASSGGAVVAFRGVHTVRSLVAANLVDEYWLKFNPADQVELDVLRRQVVEQPSPLPEQDRYDVQFQLVELPGPQQRLRRHGLCTITSPSPAAARPCKAHSRTSVT